MQTKQKLLILFLLAPASLCGMDSKIRRTPTQEEVRASRSHLINAITTGKSIEEVRPLIGEKRYVNLPDALGTTPLIAAVIFNREDVVRELAAAGANPDLQDIADMTALHHAVRKNQPSIICMLFQLFKADPTILDCCRKTPLTSALGYTRIGQQEALYVLLDNLLENTPAAVRERMVDQIDDPEDRSLVKRILAQLLKHMPNSDEKES